MNKENMKQIMLDEAIKRMKLLGIAEKAILNFEDNREPTIVEVSPIDNGMNIQDYLVKTGRPSRRVLEMIRKLEKDKQILVYYMICDQGVWPDGETFERISMLHVDKYINDYTFAKEECIGRCKTVPAYVYNVNEDFIELTEIAYKKVDGCLVQFY